jgi:hypothetical protein
MSEIAGMPGSKRHSDADKHAFAQVEKWLELVREVSFERQSSVSTQLERLLAPVAD